MAQQIVDISNILSRTIEGIRYGEDPIELYEPIRYIMGLGGKRLRPMLALIAASMYAPNDWQKAIRPAIAVEVFHNFSLVHDDIMDNAPLRRGKPTVHTRWNKNIAILSGDVMLVKAYDFLLGIEPILLPQVLKKFNQVATDVCEGQQLDMNFEILDTVSEGKYMQMIRLKTSVLLGFALELGGRIAGASEKDSELLYEIGVNVGIGFQLQDDLLDVYGDPQKFGKQVGGDIIANKKTFLLINALAKASDQNRKKLEHWLTKTTFDSQQKVQAIIEIYDQLAIRQLTEQTMNQYFDAGFAQIQQLSLLPEQKNMLLEFCQELMKRQS